MKIFICSDKGKGSLHMKSLHLKKEVLDAREEILGEAEKYEDWHDLPSDTGVYAIQIQESGELYIGATTKVPMVSKNTLVKFGIYDRISHHLTAWGSWSTSHISEVMSRVAEGELHATYYVLGYTIDPLLANRLETHYILALEPELNTQWKSNLTKTRRKLTDTEKRYLSVEEVDPMGDMAVMGSRWTINGAPEARRIKVEKLERLRGD